MLSGGELRFLLLCPLNEGEERRFEESLAVNGPDFPLLSGEDNIYNGTNRRSITVILRVVIANPFRREGKVTGSLHPGVRQPHRNAADKAGFIVIQNP